MKKVLSLSLLLISFLMAKEVTVYVNDHYQSGSLTQSKWGATIEYLQDSLPQYHFSFLPINPKDIKSIKEHLNNKHIDFLITQPIIYSQMNYSYGVQRLLTLENRHGMTKFGSVFITHKESAVKTIQDIKGKSIAAVAPLGFGGWLIGYNQLLDAGIDSLKDKKVSFLGSQNKIALAISNREYDVGIIRTGMLELLVHKGLLDISKIRVVNALKTPFPVKISTKLYPEWVFAVASHVDNNLAKNVFKAMVNIKKSDRAAIIGKYSTWVIPEDYSDVDALLKRFRLAQYKDIPQYDLKDIIIITAAILFSVFVLFFYFRYKILVQAEKDQKKKVIEITQEIEKKDKIMLMQSRHAAMGEMLSMIAHQWRQPLANITTITSHSIVKATLKKYSQEDIANDMRKLEQTALHLSTTIHDFSNYFKPNKEQSSINLSDLINKLLQIIENSVIDEGVDLQKVLDDSINFTTYGNDLIQIILNLVQNAKEALIELKVDKPTITLKTFIKEANVYILVCDNAGGIDEAIKAQVFDPYFSTKEKNGTGLGLYMSKSITEDHLNGNLDFKNNDDGGVCFSLILPYNKS